MEPLLPHPSLPFTIVMFAVVIGVLVFVHEFGHYAIGRLFGVKADVFSIGFGRELFGWNDSRVLAGNYRCCRLAVTSSLLAT